MLATGFPYDVRQRLPETLARIGGVLGISQGLRRGGSAALDLAYVAAGRLDGFWEENLKPWDTAAGVLLVTEAGGAVSMFTGSSYDITSPNILASNGLLHQGLVSLSCQKINSLSSDEFALKSHIDFNYQLSYNNDVN